MKTTKVLLASSIMASVAIAAPNLSEIHPDTFDSQVFTLGMPIKVDLSDGIGGSKKTKSIGVSIQNKATLSNPTGDSELYWRGGGSYNYNFNTNLGVVEANIAVGNTFSLTDNTFFNLDLGAFYNNTTGSSNKGPKDFMSYGLELSATYGFNLIQGIDVGLQGSYSMGKARFVSEKENIKSLYFGAPVKFNLGEGVYLNLDIGYKSTDYGVKSVKDSRQAVAGLSISWKYSL